jgi:hypothetical protein
MKNKISFKEVSNYKFAKEYYRPHPKYNVKYLLNSIYHLFGLDMGKLLPEDTLGDGGECDNVILIVIDGLSFYLYERAMSLLKKEIVEFFDKNFLVSKITTMFPSSTTALIPYFMTGFLPEESGLYEWWQFEHNSQELVCPFTYQYKRNKEKFDMKELDVDPKDIFSKSKFYENLTKNGINVSSFTENYTTPFNNIVNEEIVVKPAENINGYIDNLLESELKGKNFCYIYSPSIDYFQHKNGVDSKECHDGLVETFEALYRLTTKVKEGSLGKTKIIITADHGLTDIEYTKILMLDKKMKDIERYLKESKKGHKIVNGGSPRACILHIKEELVDEFLKEVKKYISGYGEAYRRDELVEKGIFNTDVKFSDSFDRNMGNVILLAYDGEGIWFDEDMSSYKALHGGLSEKEMHIPLIITKTS